MTQHTLSVLFVATEVDPYATKAGLAQVAGSLPQAIQNLQTEDLHLDIRVMMPKYSNKELRALEEARPFHTVISRFQLPFEGRAYDVAVQRDDRFGVTTYLVDNDELFGSDPRIYWPSADGIEIPNLKRFAFFSRAVLEILKRLQFRPNVIHCNDWHTALVPVLLRKLYGNDPFFRDSRQGHYTGSILTLHNVGRGFQGIWPLNNKPDILDLTGLGAYKDLYVPSYLGMTHSARPNLATASEINLVKGGVIYADRVNTVSPTYRDEMLTDRVITGSEGWINEKYDYADNLMAFLQHYKDKFSGIVNGLDYAFRDGEPPKGWDPAKDTCIARTFTSVGLNRRTGRIPRKNLCKRALQKTIGLTVDETIPLIGMVGRLEPQKGVVLLTEYFRKKQASGVENLDAQFLICGKPGEDKEGQRLGKELLEAVDPFDEWVKVDMTFVPEAFMHQLFAGCDMILMPSEYEPCGTPQLQAHRYGAIPIVRKTGGLADTVTDGVDGFLFESEPWGSNPQKIERAAVAMFEVIERAVDVYRKDGRKWGQLIHNAMARDHTWTDSAKAYLALYRQVVG